MRGRKPFAFYDVESGFWNSQPPDEETVAEYAGAWPHAGVVRGGHAYRLGGVTV
jgi:hypothetical protein